MACYFKQRLNSKTAKLLRRRKREVGLKCCKPDLNLYQQNEQNNSTYLHSVLTRCEVIRFQLSTHITSTSADTTTNRRQSAFVFLYSCNI